MIARLPPLSLGDNCCELPLAEPSAAALLTALVDPQAPLSLARLQESLTLDPALALWAVTAQQAHRHGDAAEAPSIKELAAWLTMHLTAIIGAGFASTPQQDRPPAPATTAARKKYSTWAATDVTAAERAAARKAPLTDPRYLKTLLQRANQWLAAGGAPAQAFTFLPDWLQSLSTTETTPLRSASLRRTKKKTVRRADPHKSRAADARERWLVPCGFAAEQFTHVAVRLARLATLETRFSEQLEQEKLEALAEFAAGAGHEINNPLAVISGRAQLFLRHEKDPDRRHDLAVINGQARRVHEMIADLMLFARPPQPRLAACDVPALIDQLMTELLPRAMANNIALSASFPPELPTIVADATQIQVALRAVVENSFDALSAGGRVTMTCELHVEPSPLAREGRARGQAAPSSFATKTLPTLTSSTSVGHLAVTISDNGPGMTAEVRRHAFDPYFSGRGAGRGLGNGLAKCWRIVTAHGGNVDIDTSPAGTSVTLLLPIRHAPTTSATAPPTRHADGE